MKKWLSVLLCMAVILTGVSATAFAEENDAEDAGNTTYVSDEGEKDAKEKTAAGSLSGDEEKSGNSAVNTMNVQANGNLTEEELTADWAYVSGLEISEIADGTSPFDASDDAAGDDASESNLRVRSFDTVTYTLEYTADVYDDGDVAFIRQGDLCFEFLLPYSEEEAQFNTDAMRWMADYEVTTEERVIDGVNKECQVLTGRRTLLPGENMDTAIPGNGTLSVVIQVYAMANGDEITPVFRAWMNHQEKAPVMETTAEAVTVTAAPKYNVQIKPANAIYTKKKGTFDFGAIPGAPDFEAGDVRGRINVYGITLQLYSGQNYEGQDKGLKGVELPEGDITFDIELKNYFRPDGDEEKEVEVTEGYAPLLWSYGGNYGITEGEEGRDQTVLGNVGSAMHAAPYNVIGDSKGDDSRCNNGGKWQVEKEGNILHVTVSDYEINPFVFPKRDCANTARPYPYCYEGTEEIKMGCFTAGELHIVTPFYHSGTQEYILEYLDCESGDFYTQIRDYNLQAVSVSGQKLAEDKTGNSNQNITTDDVQKDKMALRETISYSNTILWSSREQVATVDVNNGQDYLRNGLDWVVPGQEAAITWGMANKEKGDDDNCMIVGKSLMKFDPAGVELTGEKRFEDAAVADMGYEGDIYFATKRDGSTWSSDQEMSEAKMEDMFYYASLEEIPEGAVCVGALFEVYPADGFSDYDDIGEYDGGSYPKASLYVKAKEGEDVTNKVYMTTISSKMWIWEDYQMFDGDGAKEKIPSMQSNNPAGPTALPKASAERHADSYTKTRYTEDGYSGGHYDGYQEGDSLYIIGEKTAIKKAALQTKNDTGEVKTDYDMQYGERVADYALYPAAEPVDSQPDGEKTRVIIRDTLPEGLSYIPGSAYIGGTYTENEQPGRQGTVTGGVQTEPDITAAEDGGTMLTWILSDVTLGEEMEPIYYSAAIGTPGNEETDVINGEELTNTAVIQSTRDMREKSALNGNLSQVTLHVIKLRASSLSKYADRMLNEVGDDIGYTVNVGNNGGSAAEKIILDVLPANGDSKGSQFDGDLIVKEWKLDIASSGNWQSWEAYYTTDAAVRGTISQDYTASDIRRGQSVVEGEDVRWTKAEIDENGSITTLIGEKPSAVVILGELESGKAYKAHVLLKVPGGAPGDKLVNSLSDGSLEVEATAYIVSRALEGTAWLDSNRDGARDAEETLLSGITVKLLKMDTVTGEYAFVTGEDKKPLTCTTGENGEYHFDILLPGTYAVQFGDEMELSEYEVTEANKEGVSDYMDSDAAGFYEGGVLKYTRIEGIVLPEIEDMSTYLYVSRYNDCGFYANTVSLAVEKEVTGNLGDKSREFHFTLTLEQDGAVYQGSSLSYVKTAQDGSSRTGTVALDEGTAEFTLKHKEKIEIADILLGSTYIVTEIDGESAGYTVTAANASGTLDRDMTVHFKNEKDTTGDLGIKTLGPPLGLTFAAGAGIAALGWNYGKLKRRHAGSRRHGSRRRR